ncbi:MFS transporter [Metallosphaera hakonensis]|uniref:MFS transporter n=1 Tax=Metallosphaera hakonensis JCM 8857 = DSM 7519 TaxID=1293036 RepID=A0A2U9IXJ2_9CREN|nr:MFS transporter [Metallosphaera hakonensis]AWS00737.1 MFS transporter [Metallosphaera hakonensis JCM 8857 = DSM 7519]
MFVTISSSLYLSALGLSPVMVGLVFLGMTAYIAGFSMALGLLGDRVGYKKSLILGDLVPALALILLISSKNLLIVIPSAIITGLGGTAGGARGAFSPGLTALVARNWREDHERVRRMGRLTSVAALAGSGGGVLLAFHDYLPFGNINDYRFLFGIASGLLLASALCVAMVQERKGERKSTRFMKRSSLSYISKVIASNVLSGAGIGLAIPLLPLWFHLRFDASALSIGFMFTLASIGTSIGSYMATKFTGNPLRLATLTRIMNGGFLIAMALSPFFPLAGALYVIRGFNAGVGMPNRTAVNVRGVSEEDFGTASSLQGVATRLSQMSSGLSGYLLEESFALPLEVGGVAQMIGGVIYFALLKERSIGKEERGYEPRRAHHN